MGYLQNIESLKQANPSDYFQMGLCLMYQKKPNYLNAIKVFQKVQTLDASKYKDERNWYTALCYLMLNDIDEARFFLNKVLNSPSSRKREDAETLLKELEILLLKK